MRIWMSEIVTITALMGCIYATALLAYGFSA